MGWFGKKDKGMKPGAPPKAPEIPELPKLPELPSLGSPREPLPQLPSFPKNVIGDKFSQDAIKDAVSGEKEVDTEGAEFDSEMRTMPMPPEKFSRDIEEGGEEIPKEWKAAATKVKNAEPVFVRIDKFEQTLKTFDKAKDKIMDIEKMLKDIRKLKDKEEEELNNWEKEIQTTKEQIERVDKELFSKIQ